MDGQKLYGEVTLDALKSKAVLATDANGVIIDAGTPVANGTYTVGIGGTTNGTITIVGGVITAIQEAS